MCMHIQRTCDAGDAVIGLQEHLLHVHHGHLLHISCDVKNLISTLSHDAGLYILSAERSVSSFVSDQLLIANAVQCSHMK